MIQDNLKTIRHYNDSLLMNTLETNLKMWLDHHLLKIGAWTDVDTRPMLDIYGNDLSKLRAVKDPSYANNTVFESRRKDWVWESTVAYIDRYDITHIPISPARIYVDGVLTAPQFINYALGRVVLNSPTTLEVTAEYSYRNVQVYIANDIPWWRELQFRIYKDQDLQFGETDRGFWSIGSQHRIQMPAILIECQSKATSAPYEIGSGSARVYQTVDFHVFAENKFDRNNLADILRGQFDNTIVLFDPNIVIASDYPLLANGDINDSTKNYDYLVEHYRYNKFRVESTEIFEMTLLHPRLYTSVIRWTCEFVI